MTLSRYTSLRRSTPESRALARLMLRRRRELLARSGGVCERCGTALTLATVDPSHRKRRREGDHRLAALCGLCRRCHGYIGVNVLIGMDEGFLVPFAADPEQAAVRIWDGRWVYLAGNGYREAV